MIEKIFLFLLVVAFVVACVLGIDWLLWKLWLFVVPALWASGPANLVHPGFWLFAAMWLLAGLLGGAIFGRGGKGRD